MTEYVTEQSSQEDKKDYHNVVRIMERLHAEEVFTTPEKSKEFLDSLSFEEFTKWTDMLNGMARKIPVSERGMKGSGHIQEGNEHLGYGVRYQPPAPSDRTVLMQEAFERAQKMADPKLAGLELAFAVNAIHPYDDGNGRTGRMLYSLLSRGYSGTGDDKEYFTALLENTKGRTIVNPDPSIKGVDTILAKRARNAAAENRGWDGPIPTYVLDGYGGAFVNEETPDQLMVSDDVSDDARMKLHNVLRDSPFEAATLIKALPPEQIKPYIKALDNGSRVLIDGDQLVATLSEEQINDLYEASQLGKREYVRSLINLDEDDFKEIWSIYNSQEIAAA